MAGIDELTKIGESALTSSDTSNVSFLTVTFTATNYIFSPILDADVLSEGDLIVQAIINSGSEANATTEDVGGAAWDGPSRWTNSSGMSHHWFYHLVTAAEAGSATLAVKFSASGACDWIIPPGRLYRAVEDSTRGSVHYKITEVHEVFEDMTAGDNTMSKAAFGTSPRTATIPVNFAGVTLDGTQQAYGYMGAAWATAGAGETTGLNETSGLTEDTHAVYSDASWSTRGLTYGVWELGGNGATIFNWNAIPVTATWTGGGSRNTSNQFVVFTVIGEILVPEEEAAFDEEWEVLHVAAGEVSDTGISEVDASEITDLESLITIGLDGATGASGSRGATGPSGASGTPGPDGPPGIEGPSGASGPSGATGPSGPAGTSGASSGADDFVMFWST